MNINAERIKRVITNLRQCDADYDNIGVYTFEDAVEAIEQLRKERDEARRMYCSMVENNARQYGTSAQSVATQAGWDCYKEETT